MKIQLKKLREIIKNQIQQIYNNRKFNSLISIKWIINYKHQINNQLIIKIVLKLM